jgi:beta-glucosidase
MAWYPGMEGGTALADVLFGNINPSGKLPIIFPKSLDQLPFFDANTKEIEYGYYHGYRLMDKEEYEPAFPFGFGLSYTYYQYKNLEIISEEIQTGEEVEISVDIKNEGTRRGEEIVQVYVGYPESPIDRPKKELKEFKRIELEPNKTKTISFTIDSKDLAYYNSDKQKWVIEQGTHTIYVGSSSLEQDLLKKTFIIS